VTPIVVAPDVGDDRSAWRDALSGWPDDIVVPDLVVAGAIGDRTDVVWRLLEQMEAWRDRAPVIVGCGEHSLAAETFALAGWVGALVLLDGLGGEWMTPDEQVAAQHAWLRAKFRDPDAPGYPRLWVESFAAALRGSIRCPVLLIETPASITPAEEVAPRASQYAGQVEQVRLDSADRAGIVEAIKAWMGS